MKKILTTIMTVFFLFSCLMFGQAQEASKKTAKTMEKAAKAIKDKKFEKALKYYDKVINKIQPDYAPVYVEKAKLMGGLKKVDEAVKLLEKALTLDPTNDMGRKILSNIYANYASQNLKEQKNAEAGQYLDKILNIKDFYKFDGKMYMWAKFQKAVMLQKENPAETEKLYSEIIKLENAKATDAQVFNNSLWNLAGMKLAKKEEEKALTLYKKYIKANADNKTDKQLPLAYYACANNDYLKLEKEVEALKKNKKDKKLKTKIAAACAKYPELENNLKKVIELKPEIEDVYMLLGNVYYYSNNIDKAIENYEILTTKFANSKSIEAYKKALASFKKEQKKGKKRSKRRRKK